MANRVLFVGWNQVVVGREKQAMQLFQKCLEYYTKQKKEGTIESFEPVLLDPHGGDLNGFWLLKGSAQKFAEIRQDSAFLDLAMEAEYCMEGFGMVDGSIGEGLTNALSRWSKFASG